MLLQSWGGKIPLYPSIPSFWHNAYFHGLKAEGGFLVTSKLRDGKVIYVKIASEVGGPCRVANPFGQDATLTNIGSGNRKKFSGPMFILKTKKGGSYLLTPEGVKLAQKELKPALSTWPKGEQHLFGCKDRMKF